MLMSRPYIDIDSVVPYRASEINYIFSIYFSVPGHSSNAHQNMPTYHYKCFLSTILNMCFNVTLMSEIRYLKYKRGKYAI